jgi:hypothetical protein
VTEGLIDDSEQILAVFHPVVSGYGGREVRQAGGEALKPIPGLGEELGSLTFALMGCHLRQMGQYGGVDCGGGRLDVTEGLGYPYRPVSGTEGCGLAGLALARRRRRLSRLCSWPG